MREMRSDYHDYRYQDCRGVFLANRTNAKFVFESSSRVIIDSSKVQLSARSIQVKSHDEELTLRKYDILLR